MFKKYIAFKLSLGFVIIVLISMLAVGLIFINTFKQYAFESRKDIMLKRANNIADVLLEYTQADGSMRGFGGFFKFLDTMSEATVWITDSAGNPAKISGMGQIHTFNNKPLANEAKNTINDVLSGKVVVSESFSNVYNEATLTVGVPIKTKTNQILGSVFLHSPVTGITDTVNKAQNILIISIIFALIITISSGVLYSMMFVKPLKTMNQAALEMANGNFDVKTGISRQDELGQLGQSIDFLSQKLSETINQLFEEKGKFSDIITSISEGIIAFDINLIPISYNNSLITILNISTKENSQPLKNLNNILTAIDISNQLKNVIENKIPQTIVKDYKEKKLKFTISPIVDNTKKPTGIVALVQDITESERLEQLRKDFVANVSHELRTPLTVIKGSIESIIDQAIDKEEINNYYNKILNETIALSHLVKDLLDLSQLQSGKLKLIKEKIYFPDVLSDSVKSMKNIANTKNIAININITNEIKPIYADYQRLRQLCIIFLDNAIKYSPGNSQILISVVENSQLEIIFKDHGFGIPEQELPFIFDRFYKADKSRNSKGTGLGLSIAKHIVELHQGTISIESELNKGTSISIFLPFE